jgi:hypothetical protein
LWFGQFLNGRASRVGDYNKYRVFAKYIVFVVSFSL